MSEKTWSHCASNEVQRQVYVLAYARVDCKDPAVLDGTESTPYARDRLSVELSQRDQAASFSSASGIAGGISCGQQGEASSQAGRRRKLSRKTSVACSDAGSEVALLQEPAPDVPASGSSSERRAAVSDVKVGLSSSASSADPTDSGGARGAAVLQGLCKRRKLTRKTSAAASFGDEASQRPCPGSPSALPAAAVVSGVVAPVDVTPPCVVACAPVSAVAHVSRRTRHKAAVEVTGLDQVPRRRSERIAARSGK